MDWYIWIIIVVVLIGIWYIGVMNTFRRMEVKIEEALSGIDVALTKRFDTLTKMWDIAKKYMKHEEETLTKVIAMRQKGTPSVSNKQELSKELDKLQAGLNVVVEQYPDLKASENMKELQRGILDVEEHLQAARRLYNSNVSAYNRMRVVFPQSIVANMVNATEKDFFEAESTKRADVTFN